MKGFWAPLPTGFATRDARFVHRHRPVHTGSGSRLLPRRQPGRTRLTTGGQRHGYLDAYLTDARKAATLGQRLTALSWVAKSRRFASPRCQLVVAPNQNTALPAPRYRRQQDPFGSRPDARHWGARRPNR